MRKLYNCSAKCDERTLISYNTRVVWTDDKYEFVGIDYYPSSTTKSHIRKYIKWLREHKLYEYANAVSMLYDYCRANKCEYAMLITEVPNIEELTYEQYKDYTRMFGGYYDL